MKRLACVLALAATSASAQDWNSVDAGGSDTWAAAATWPSGAQLVARCRSGDFEMMIGLVEPVAALTTEVGFAFDGEDEGYPQIWRLSESGGVVFVRQPARFARRLINAGSVMLEVRGKDAPRQRYELETSGESRALMEVMSACNRPLTTPPVEGAIITDPDWQRRPSGSDLAGWYPPQAANEGIEGSATIQCRVDVRGYVEDCVVVSESPEGMGFGPATIGAGTRHFRMRPQTVNGEPMDEVLVNITVRWLLG